jgi:N-acetylneuraminate synthase
MSTLDEIDHAVNLFPSTYDLILMHCTSTYPVADEEINLRAIKTLRDRYMIPVGYSSHDKSPFSSLYALALGAWGIEAHVTLDRAMKGTDQSASLEKPALELIARERNRIPVVMGDGKKVVYASEKSSLEKLRGM